LPPECILFPYTTLFRSVRAAFVASDGKIISADYSQIELRVMAHMSDDENLRCAFLEGDDIHRATAAEVFGTTPAEVTADQRRARSEEHTSELQSRENLV